MKIVSGFFVYKVYVTYKAHFNQPNADISKYNYALFNVEYTSFLNTKGQYYYDKLAKRIQKESELVSLFISAFLNNPNTWIGDIVMDLSFYIELKEARESRIANLNYLFRKDCINMIVKGLKFDNGIDEFVFKEFMDSNIELETFIIFKQMFDFNLDNNITYDYTYKGKYLKYEYLLKVNLKKYKLLLREALMSFRD